MSQSFTLKGKVNLGNKNATQGGADGIGIVFHPNSINDIGSYGGGLGIGGLSKAFGFKLDTWYNESGEATFIKDPLYLVKIVQIQWVHLFIRMETTQQLQMKAQ